MAETEAHAGESKVKRPRSKWRFALLAVGVIVVAGAAGMGVRWLQQYREHKGDGRLGEAALTAAEIQDIALDGDFDKAHDELNKALNNPRLTPEGKYSLLFQEGVTYENQHQYDAAIASYKKAEAVQATQAVAEAIARTAESKGDKQLAIEYYKKAIKRIDPNKPVAEDTKLLYQSAVTRLEGQP